MASASITALSKTALSKILWYIMLAVILFILAFTLYYFCWFLRNPKINITKDKNAIVSPADGKIIRVIEFDDVNVKINKGYLGRTLTLTKDVAKEGSIICVQMNPFNIHYQKAPVDGLVEKVKYSEGKLRNVFSGAELLRFIDNEKNEILIYDKNYDLKLKVVQIAGAFARRIDCFAHKGMYIKKGENIGLIRFGSMVLLIIPKDKVELNKKLVKAGSRVYVGQSIIGKIISKKKKK